MVVNMNIVVRNNISSKLKNSAPEIGYYSYTKSLIKSIFNTGNLCQKFKIYLSNYFNNPQLLYVIQIFITVGFKN